MQSTKICIDKEICTGCRECAKVCPVDAIVGNMHQPQTIMEDKCILCGQCVQTCKSYASVLEKGKNFIENKRKERKLNNIKEPIFAAYSTAKLEEVDKNLKGKKTFKVVQCAPAVRVAIAEEFGMNLGCLTPKKMVAALKALGFDRVYDTNFAADLTILEEGSELVERIKKQENLTMFTSCCPAWVKFMEQNYPQLLNHLSTCKSPQQMAGAMIKTYAANIDNIDAKNIYSLAVMPCTCKSFEAYREEMNSSGFQDVDEVITTRELAQLIKLNKIDFINLEEEDFDKPLGIYSGAGTIFGNTGGVMEAALRTAVEVITQEKTNIKDFEFIRGNEGIRTAKVKAGDIVLNVAVVAGLKPVIPILEDLKRGIKKYDFIEVMTCPQGCVSGGGQPKLISDEFKDIANLKRKESIYQHDSELKCRKSHENPEITKIYKEFLKNPLGAKSHHLLHTHYINRKDV